MEKVLPVALLISCLLMVAACNTGAGQGTRPGARIPGAPEPGSPAAQTQQ